MKKIILLVIIFTGLNIEIFAQNAEDNYDFSAEENKNEEYVDENGYYYEYSDEDYATIVVYDQNDNPIYNLDDYKKLLEYKTLAIEAYREGDYTKSYEYSEMSEKLASNVIYTSRFLWIQLSAENFRKEAVNQYTIFESTGGKTNLVDVNKYITDSYESGTNYMQTALTETEENKIFGSYSNAIDDFKEVITASISGYLLIDAKKRYNEILNNKVITKGDINDGIISGYLDKSKNYLDESNYDDSIENSKEAIFAIDKLNQNLEPEDNLELKDEAIRLFVKAGVAFNKAKDDKFIDKETDSFKKAHILIYNAQESLKKSYHKDVIENSKQTIAILEEIIKSKTASNPTLPAYYVVVKREKGSDSFWRIASYVYIYGSGVYWEKLYLANKDKLTNPFILQPGVILKVPPLKGEKREGTYDPAKEYSATKTTVIEDIVITKETKIPVIEKPNY